MGLLSHTSHDVTPYSQVHKYTHDMRRQTEQRMTRSKDHAYSYAVLKNTLCTFPWESLSISAQHAKLMPGEQICIKHQFCTKHKMTRQPQTKCDPHEDTLTPTVTEVMVM